MKNILVPTDFSEEAINALDTALEFNKINNCKITLLHVVDLPSPPSPVDMVGDYITQVPDTFYLQQFMENSKEKMRMILKDPKFSSVGISEKVVLGNIYNSIELETVENRIDLIIMGSKGSSGIDEFLIGSNTEKVVRRVKCPVLTVKKKQPVFSLKDVVFATNLSEDQGIVLDKVKKIQALFGSTIHLLRVNTPDHFLDTKSLNKQMTDFVQRYQLQNFTLNVYNSKNTEEGIINFAEQINANMIAMGTHGRTGISHLISGSIAEDVVNHATRMVLTVNMSKK